MNVAASNDQPSVMLRRRRRLTAKQYEDCIPILAHVHRCGKEEDFKEGVASIDPYVASIVTF